MGFWGFYDDENDSVADEWAYIESEIFPNNTTNRKMSNGDLNNLRRQYVVENPKKVYETIKKHLAVFEKNLETYYEEDSENMNENEWIEHLHISGLALKAVRVFLNSPQSDPLGSGIFKTSIPAELPKDFPEWLRINALKSTEFLLDTAEYQEFSNLQHRKQSLLCQMYLFSKGKKGKTCN